MSWGVALRKGLTVLQRGELYSGKQLKGINKNPFPHAAALIYIHPTLLLLLFLRLN